MSLSTLNYPPLVAIAGGAATVGLPYLEKIVIDGGITWTALKAANLVAFAVQVVAVGRPGRIDGEVAKTIEEEETTQKKAEGISDVGEKLSPRSGNTLVAPSGWAFAIWGPIFTGEAIFAVSQFFLPESSPLVTVIKSTSIPFITTQALQTLWCAAFRPKYKDNLMYISSALLASGAYSLSKAHTAFASQTDMYSITQYLVHFLPMSLHFGWLTAATLVNLNGAVAMKEGVSPKLVRFVGHASVIGATILGVAVTVGRSAPVYGGVISWALFAVSDGMKKRIESQKKRDVISGTDGALTQKRLSTVGAVICLGTSIVTGLAMAFWKK